MIKTWKRRRSFPRKNNGKDVQDDIIPAYSRFSTFFNFLFNLSCFCVTVYGHILNNGPFEGTNLTKKNYNDNDNTILMEISYKKCFIFSIFETYLKNMQNILISMFIQKTVNRK